MDHRSGLVKLFQDDLVSLWIEFNPRHEFPHQHQPTPAGAFEILVGSGVGNLFGLKAWTLVFNLDPDTLFIRLKVNPYGLIGAETIAMLDGIDHRFVDGKADSKRITRGKAALTDKGHDPFDNRLTRFIVAWNHNLELTVL
jgi:hypothetical protein